MEGTAVADLCGNELDYWVARAQGWEPVFIGDLCYADAGALSPYYPSRSWAEGGPIIGRCRMRFDDLKEEILASMGTGYVHQYAGATHLEAGMRCFVASIYGHEAVLDTRADYAPRLPKMMADED